MDNNQQLKECPYDKMHQVRPERFITHLVRCCRSHPTIQVCCPHNAAHIVSPGEMDEHLKGCDSKALSKYMMDQQVQQKPEEQPYFGKGENWDDDPDEGTYDPTSRCEQALIIRKPINLTWAQRKQFRLSERSRHEKLEKENEKEKKKVLSQN
ncbi:gametocyte-specific factor 1 homolog [Scaptodrosophila lebanonensis]|uniref:Gametocyte-specific factor 1 homolog n=1 Tax=Drosophila lebanonensis TaxID=7225 RepID=A0A6J2UBJ9_DROLE|nr:gametocyte-specific factor 1 homolog [Scaptodrosophila lebanonensis]